MEGRSVELRKLCWPYRSVEELVYGGCSIH